MKILVDADFLVALAKEDDSNHKKAFLKAKALKGVILFATPFTVPEAVTVISYKISQQSAIRFLTSARKQNFVELSLDNKIIKEADRIFLSRKEKGISWVDCLNVSFVKAYKLDGILSFDKFYKKVGIKVF